MEIIEYQQIWVHETTVLHESRKLRHRHFGIEYSGGYTTRLVKKKVMQFASVFSPLGRRLFASNLFALAKRRNKK
jgi:hypothetical protein